jgi:acyl carrier protein
MDHHHKILQMLKKLNTYSKVDSLNSEDNLFEKGVLDSLMLIQFVLSLEDEFKIKFSNQDINYDNFSSIKKIDTLLAQLNK